MKSKTYDVKPMARQENLIMSEMAEEVLVYDRTSHTTSYQRFFTVHS